MGTLSGICPQTPLAHRAQNIVDPPILRLLRIHKRSTAFAQWYYIFLHDSFAKNAIYRKQSDVEVDFTETDIADQPELQAEICERLTPTKDYTFRINEEAPIMHYFTGVWASVKKVKSTKYIVYITSMNIYDLNGQTVSSGPMASYGFVWLLLPLQSIPDALGGKAILNAFSAAHLSRRVAILSTVTQTDYITVKRWCSENENS